MKIETISVRNFRCFGPEWMEVGLQEQVTTFVGGNGSGKTALFQALSRLFGVTKTDRTVTKKDFHIGHDEEELPDGKILEIECLLGFPELDTRNNPTFEKIGSIKIKGLDGYEWA